MSTPIATFSGIASGIDANTLITNLVAVEKQPEQALQQHQSDLQSQISTLGSIASALQSLASAAGAIDSPASIAGVTASTSDAGVVSASAAASATPGSYSVVVTRLALAQTSASAGLASDAAAGDGAFTLTAGGGAHASVSFHAGDTLESIAAQVNQQAGAAVAASVLFDGSNYRLVVTSKATGTANALAFGESGSALGFSTAQPARDASFSVNGVGLTRGGNVVSDAIPGVTLTLAGPSADSAVPAVVTVGADSGALQKNVQALVDAYNSAVKLVTGQLSYNGVTRGPDTLFGDSTIQGLELQLGGALANAYGSTKPITSADLGLKLQSDGTLTLDATAFTEAMTADPTAAQRLLVGDGSNGLAQALEKLVTQYTQFGTGTLVTESASKQSQIKSYTDQISAIDEHAATLETSLRAQFAKLDQVMATLTSQQSYLNALFNTTTTSSSSSKTGG